MIITKKSSQSSQKTSNELSFAFMYQKNNDLQRTQIFTLKQRKMIQQSLLSSVDLGVRTINMDNIKAVFTNVKDNMYEVVLEISSHKFVISLENILEKIEKFEILAMK